MSSSLPSSRSTSSSTATHHDCLTATQPQTSSTGKEYTITASNTITLACTTFFPDAQPPNMTLLPVQSFKIFPLHNPQSLHDKKPVFNFSSASSLSSSSSSCHSQSSSSSLSSNALIVPSIKPHAQPNAPRAIKFTFTDLTTIRCQLFHQWIHYAKKKGINANGNYPSFKSPFHQWLWDNYPLMTLQNERQKTNTFFWDLPPHITPSNSNSYIDQVPQICASYAMYGGQLTSKNKTY